MSDQGSPKMPGRSETSTDWWDRHKAAILEAFVLSNFAFLILDVYLAHLVNRFRHPAEWMPV
ncbi:MAG: hypothetical protein OSB03_07505 [Vicinamibacterales bacterium]|nr:hypothetical protein [Vicinamibacterales bacterium]